MALGQIQPQTDAQKAKVMAASFIIQLKHSAKSQFDLAWKKFHQGKLVNKTLEEAQAFWNEMGTDSAAAMDAHAGLQQLIYFVDNSWVPLVPVFQYVKNQDGTVTLSQGE